LSPTNGDTLTIIYESTFPVNTPNGITCGTLIQVTDTIINSELFATLHFDICFIPSFHSCNRKDTIDFPITISGLNIATFDMKLKPTCVVFQHRVYNSNTINFNTTSIENYIQKNVFSIKPNPVQNQLTIENTKKANLQQIQF